MSDDGGKRLRGRPSSYTDEIAAEICERLARGETLTAVCKEDGMPGYSTVARWLDAHEVFRQAYARARDAQADYLAADIIGIADDAAKRGEDPQLTRLRVDVRKWYASKMRPKVYGERIEVEQTVKAVIASEPLNEDEWSKRYGGGGGDVAPASGSAEGTG